MLVLSRRIEEVIKIGNDIEIQVIRVKGSNVRLGITAPKELVVLRGELEITDVDTEV